MPHSADLLYLALRDAELPEPLLRSRFLVERVPRIEGILC